MWNLKNNRNKQNRNRLVDTENRQTLSEGSRVGGLGERGEGIEKYKSVVPEQS